MNYPTFMSPEGKEYKCILFAVSVGSGWEWFGFEECEDGEYFGLVQGFETEFGYFHLSELEENNVPVTTNSLQINEIMPPIGWTRKAGN